MRLLLLLLVCWVQVSFAQVTIRITSWPASTPANPQFYLAGTMNGWNPSDSNFRFTQSGNGYELQIPAGTGTAQYKITRGSWATGEGTATGGQSANRSFTYSPNLNIDIQIIGWENVSNQTSTALPNVKIVNANFPMPQLNTTRRVWIYLPNDYDSNSTKRYPVFYLQDGQNIFDVVTSFNGEWEVDETLSNKQKQGDKGCIVVSIDNAASSRIDEYSPYVNKQYGGGKGEAYAQFIVESLKPYIDSNYRTQTDRNNTAIGGSSLGANISLYAFMAYPTVFSKVALFSPALWFSDSLYDFVNQQPATERSTFYFVAGRKESQTMVSDMESMIALLQTKGYLNTAIQLVVKEDGEHKDWFWRREFGPCYDWLLKDVTNSLSSLTKEEEFSVYPNPTMKVFSISRDAKSIILMDTQQQIIQMWMDVTANENLSISGIKSGQYFLSVETNQGRITKKMVID